MLGSLAVRAAVVTFDVISATTAKASGPAQRTAGHATSVLAAAPCPCAIAFPVWAGRVPLRAEPVGTFVAGLADVINTLMSSWRLLP